MRPWVGYSMAFRTSVKVLEQDPVGRAMLRQARGVWGKAAGEQDRRERQDQDKES